MRISIICVRDRQGDCQTKKRGVLQGKDERSLQQAGKENAMDRRKLIIPCILCILLHSTITFAFGASETVSKTGKDSIRISAILPSTSAYVLSPAKLTYSAKLQYSLTSYNQGTIVLNLYRLPETGAIEILAPPYKTPVPGGNGARMLCLQDILIDKAPRENEKLFFVASLVSPDGKEIAYSSSVNYLIGTLTEEYEQKTATNDYIQVISVQPQPGSILPECIRSRFIVKLVFNTKTSAHSYALIQFCTMTGLDSFDNLREYYIPLPSDRGILTITIPNVVISQAKKDSVVGLLIKYYANPFDKPTSTDKVWPYNLTR